MTETDWNAPAKLLERDDAGSEMFYEFKEVRAGSLRELVTHVSTLGTTSRARMVIDAGAAGTFAVDQILELARRGDLTS
jgi:hypothetical protein